MSTYLVPCDKTPYEVFGHFAIQARSFILDICESSRGKLAPTSADLARAVKVANGLIKDGLLAISAMSSVDRIKVLDEFFPYSNYMEESDSFQRKWAQLIDTVRSLCDSGAFMGQGRIDLLMKRYKKDSVQFIPTRACGIDYLHNVYLTQAEQDAGAIVFPPKTDNIPGNGVAIDAPGQTGKYLVKIYSRVFHLSMYAIAPTIQGAYKTLLSFERETTRKVDPKKVALPQIAKPATIAVPRSGGVLWIVQQSRPKFQKGTIRAKLKKSATDKSFNDIPF